SIATIASAQREAHPVRLGAKHLVLEPRLNGVLARRQHDELRVGRSTGFDENGLENELARQQSALGYDGEAGESAAGRRHRLSGARGGGVTQHVAGARGGETPGRLNRS